MDLRAVAAVVVAPVLAAGCFELERSDGLRPGDIRVVVVDEAGAPVPGARVTAVGTERVGVSNEDGVAIVGPMPFGDYVLRVDADRDGDGVDELGTVIPSVTTIAKPKIAGLPRLSFAEHLEVVVTPTGSIAGSVTCPIDRLCRVVAFRTVAGLTLPIEANAAVDGAGRFQLDEIAVGEVQVAAFAWAPSLSTDAQQQQLAATKPDAVGTVTATIDDDDDDVTIALAAAPATATAGIELRIAPAAAEASTDESFDGRSDVEGDAFYVLPGTLSVPANPDIDDATVPGDAVAMPLGVFDISVTVDGFGGRLFNVVGTASTAQLLPITIGSFDCELVQGVVDCNRDGVADYADLDAVDIDNDGLADVDDPDVDSDGIVDADEPSACVRVGAGGDRDGDCLCDAFDPLPDCQSNDPLACSLPTAPTCN